MSTETEASKDVYKILDKYLWQITAGFLNYNQLSNAKCFFEFETMFDVMLLCKVFEGRFSIILRCYPQHC